MKTGDVGFGVTVACVEAECVCSGLSYAYVYIYIYRIACANRSRPKVCDTVTHGANLGWYWTSTPRHRVTVAPTQDPPSKGLCRNTWIKPITLIVYVYDKSKLSCTDTDIKMFPYGTKVTDHNAFNWIKQWFFHFIFLKRNLCLFNKTNNILKIREKQTGKDEKYDDTILHFHLLILSPKFPVFPLFIVSSMRTRFCWCSCECRLPPALAHTASRFTKLNMNAAYGQFIVWYCTYCGTICR